MLLLPRFSFRGGVHPLKSQGEGKLPARNEPIRDFVSDAVVIPMNMHLGAPSKPCVKKGERVRIGQVVGEPMGGLGLSVHASVSGEVTAVEDRLMLGATPAPCVCIRNDFAEEWVELVGLGDVEALDPALVIPAIKNAGICGMGGAGFPTHVKLTIPSGKVCDTLIVNGAECETYLTADFRLMVEQPKRIVDGLRAIMRALNVPRGVVGIEDNKPEAIAAMRAAAVGRTGVEVMALHTKYPQGGEKQLIEAVTGRQVPSCGLPVDAGVIVVNVATACAIADALVEGRPLVERVTTVTGCVGSPGNLRVRIGTVVGDIIGACGGYTCEPGKIILGGGMTGLCAPDDGVPIAKTTGGVVVFDRKEAASVLEEPCIRCARCVEVCPIGLRPYLMKHYCDAGDFEGARAHDVLECILCGACSYVCPARRWLTASFKVGKDAVVAAQRRKK
ncbi:MAG TPA: electron transport complex subunit RsxC [Clostridia bacterium]|nr:electron transport complex subunit RsxC [Clostridia bacterium]